MQISMEPIIYGMIFFGILALVQGLYLLIFGRAISLNNRLNRRMTMLEKGSDRQEVLEQLRKEMRQHLDAKGIPLYSLLADKAQKANIAFSPRALILIMILLTIVSFGALSFMTQASLPVRIGTSILMGVGAVYVWISKTAKKRIGMIEEQLPDAVDLMVRSLRVGHPFASAVNIVASEIPDPLGSEFGVIADESSYGGNISDSLKELAERVDMQDMRFLAVAVTIQQQSGGNLAEILEGLGRVIRARFRLFRRVRAITAEAKWSGMFLSFFPLLAILMINILKPDYYDRVKETAAFIPAAIAVGVFLIVNVIFMRMMVNIKV